MNAATGSRPGRHRARPTLATDNGVPNRRRVNSRSGGRSRDANGLFREVRRSIRSPSDLNRVTAPVGQTCRDIRPAK
jgi:hypothetical protein